VTTCTTRTTPTTTTAVTAALALTSATYQRLAERHDDRRFPPPAN